MNSKTKKQQTEPNVEITQSNDHQNIYADRLTNFSMGAAVTKLNFSNEVDSSKATNHLTITIPTFAFIEAIDFLAKTIDYEQSLKTEILTNLDKFKARLEKN